MKSKARPQILVLTVIAFAVLCVASTASAQSSGSSEAASDSETVGAVETAETSRRFRRIGIGAGFTSTQIRKLSAPASAGGLTYTERAAAIFDLEIAIGKRTSEMNALYGWGALDVFTSFGSDRLGDESGFMGFLVKLGIGDELRMGNTPLYFSAAAGGVLQLYPFVFRDDVDYGPGGPLYPREARADIAPGIGGELQFGARLNQTERPVGLALYGGAHVVFADGEHFTGGQIGVRVMLWR